LLHLVPERAPVCVKVEVHEAGQVTKKSLVYRIHLNIAGELAQRIHDAGAHIAIEGIIARKHGDAMLPDQVFDLEIGLSHFDAQRLNLRNVDGRLLHLAVLR